MSAPFSLWHPRCYCFERAGIERSIDTHTSAAANTTPRRRARSVSVKQLLGQTNTNTNGPLLLLIKWSPVCEANATISVTIAIVRPTPRQASLRTRSGSLRRKARLRKTRPQPVRARALLLIFQSNSDHRSQRMCVARYRRRDFVLCIIIQSRPLACVYSPVPVASPRATSSLSRFHQP